MGAFLSALLLAIVIGGIAEAQSTTAALTSQPTGIAFSLMTQKCPDGSSCQDASSHHHCASHSSRVASIAQAETAHRKNSVGADRCIPDAAACALATDPVKPVIGILHHMLRRRGAPYWATFATTQRMLS